MKHLRPLRILLTGSGAPGAWGLIGALRSGADRDVAIVGVDMRSDAVGFAICDRSHAIPSASSPEFASQLLGLCEAEKIDVVLPLVTRELPISAARRDEFEAVGTHVVVSPPEVIALMNDKAAAIETVRAAGLPAPDSHAVHSVDEMRDAATALGYPGVPVVVKPCSANGGRGARILDPSVDRLRLLLEEKPSSLLSTLDDVTETLRGADPFPPYVVMEYLPGDEYSVDCLTDGPRALAVVPRSRDHVRSGVSFIGTAVHDTAIIDLCEKMTAVFQPYGPVGYQLRRDAAGVAKLIEVNPRLQGTTALAVAAGANIPWLAVRLALGESVDVGPIAWGPRIIRYWGDTFRAPDGRIIEPPSAGPESTS